MPHATGAFPPRRLPSLPCHSAAVAHAVMSHATQKKRVAPPHGPATGAAWARSPPRSLHVEQPANGLVRLIDLVDGGHDAAGEVGRLDALARRVEVWVDRARARAYISYAA